MHFISVPVRKLQKKGGWAQVRFSAKKILARAFRGEELKDEYKIEGRLILRLLTSAGKMDYEMSINVTLEDIPF
jgi:hypothetical protein